MEKATLRILFTILMYAGVLLCFLPHLSGKSEAATLFFLTGVVIAVVCGVLRCCCMEEKA